jgi:hypothetical protein
VLRSPTRELQRADPAHFRIVGLNVVECRTRCLDPINFISPVTRTANPRASRLGRWSSSHWRDIRADGTSPKNPACRRASRLDFRWIYAYCENHRRGIRRYCGIQCRPKDGVAPTYRRAAHRTHSRSSCYSLVPDLITVTAASRITPRKHHPHRRRTVENFNLRISPRAVPTSECPIFVSNSSRWTTYNIDFVDARIQHHRNVTPTQIRFNVRQ